MVPAPDKHNCLVPLDEWQNDNFEITWEDNGVQEQVQTDARGGYSIPREDIVQDVWNQHVSWRELRVLSDS